MVNKMKLIFSLLVLNTLAQQLTPIPSPMDGFQLGPTTSNYSIDVFYDHLCADSAAAFPGLYQYWQSNQGWLGLNIHIFPLPYFKFSFMVAQAGRYIQQTYPAKFIQFLSYMFTYQNIVLNNYQTWTYSDAQLKVSGLTNQATSIPTNEIGAALNNTAVGNSSEISWKYSASRMMTGAPRYLINDIWVPSVTGFTTAAQWNSFFQNISSIS